MKDTSRMTQEQRVRYIWRNYSEYGKARKRRIMRWAIIGTGAIVGILLGIFAR